MEIVLSGLFMLTGFMVAFLARERQRLRQRSVWREHLATFLQRAIAMEPGIPGYPHVPIPFRIGRGLRLPDFRQLLIDELITAKKALAGAAADNLVSLYKQLGLEKDTAKKLTSREWHLQAKGIQELAVMEQRQHPERLYRLTNNRNDLVRMEAQSAIIQLYGFEGLRFLDVTDRPLSEWQQIKLLRLLAGHSGILPDNIAKWLSSPNDCVRIFALKLVADNHLQQLHDHAAARLNDASPAVRLQAVLCLRVIGQPDTPAALVGCYNGQDAACRLAILEALADIGTGEECGFLADRLTAEEESLRLAAARALAKMGAVGMQFLDCLPQRSEYPWTVIIAQAKTECTL